MDDRNAEQPLTFEMAMEKLESVVDQLEQGDVPLEEAISTFKEGMTLSKYCHDKLKSVETQMDQIINEDGEVELTVFQEEVTGE